VMSQTAGRDCRLRGVKGMVLPGGRPLLVFLPATRRRATLPHTKTEGRNPFTGWGRQTRGGGGFSLDSSRRVGAEHPTPGGPPFTECLRVPDGETTYRRKERRGGSAKADGRGGRSCSGAGRGASPIFSNQQSSNCGSSAGRGGSRGSHRKPPDRGGFRRVDAGDCRGSGAGRSAQLRIRPNRAHGRRFPGVAGGRSEGGGGGTWMPDVPLGRAWEGPSGRTPRPPAGGGGFGSESPALGGREQPGTRTHPFRRGQQEGGGTYLLGCPRLGPAVADRGVREPAG